MSDILVKQNKCVCARERERERSLITSKFRKGPPVIMAMLLNESDEPQVLSRAPRTPLHLTLITAWCSSSSHGIISLSWPELSHHFTQRENHFCSSLANESDSFNCINFVCICGEGSRLEIYIEMERDFTNRPHGSCHEGVYPMLQ